MSGKSNHVSSAVYIVFTFTSIGPVATAPARNRPIGLLSLCLFGDKADDRDIIALLFTKAKITNTKKEKG